MTEPARASAGSSSAASPPSTPSPRAWSRRLALVLGGLVVALGTLAARAAVEGRAELAAADQAHARADLDAEVEHLGRALRWRLPVAGHDEAALERLWARGEAEQARGPEGRPTALAAFRELREGLLATRVWGVPHQAQWEAANERIAALMAEQEVELGTDPTLLDDRRVHHLALLSRVPGPAPARAGLAALAFAGWVGCTAGVLVRGLGPRGRLRPRPALRWGLGVLLCLVAWAVLLATAHG